MSDDEDADPAEHGYPVFDLDDPLEAEFVENYTWAVEHTEHGPLECPSCGVGIFGVTDYGDPAICVACRSLVVLDMKAYTGPWPSAYHPVPTGPIPVRAYLRRPTAEEEELFLMMPSIKRAIDMVAQLHRRHGMPPV